jgi:DNA-directed RNA polymerase subunit omega
MIVTRRNSMIYPTLKNLLDKVDSKYTLVVAVAKRARQIVDGQPKLTKVNSNKPVTIAVNEIAEGKVTYERNSNKNVEPAIVEEANLEQTMDMEAQDAPATESYVEQ